MNEDEERCVITPKGILYCALNKAEVEFTDMQFEYIWLMFETDMEKCGYIKNEEEED